MLRAVPTYPVPRSAGGCQRVDTARFPRRYPAGYAAGVLHGRDAERSALAGLLDEAWASRSGTIVLRGSPGVGKSALLDDTVARASGVRVLRTRGVESESELPFAALHQLLRPVWSQVDRLPSPQATALRVAFGYEFGHPDGPSSERFLISLGV